MDLSSNLLDKYGDDDSFTTTILKWGLYFGAFFQLACILTSILLPYASASHHDKVDSLEDSKANGNDSQPINRRLHKIRKQEKKKRR